MYITTIEGLRHYLKDYSGFSLTTIDNVVNALGFSCRGSMARLKELSTQPENCAEHGADIGIPGFIYYSETVAFYRTNRADIVSHMERTAAEMGTDIISMVQGFGVFRNQDKPTTGEIGKALWGPIKDEPKFIALYNVFAWYALEEVARIYQHSFPPRPCAGVSLYCEAIGLIPRSLLRSKERIYWKNESVNT